MIGLVLGALLFAGALADGGERGVDRPRVGPLCAALGWLAVGGLVERVRARLDAGPGRARSPPTPTAPR